MRVKVQEVGSLLRRRREVWRATRMTAVPMVKNPMSALLRACWAYI
jgi:hypothetical protein